MRESDEIVELELVSQGTSPSVAAVRALLGAYGAYIEKESGGRDVLIVQGFDAEVSGLPGEYGPPAGALLLARVNGEPAGTVAMRPVGDGVVEMKRLYVSPQFRGRSLGQKLVGELLTRAVAAGSRRVVLDTMPFMQTAAHMYRDLGFVASAPYLERHADGARCMALDLEAPEPQARMLPFRAEWRGDFERLNREWLEEFFQVEPRDAMYFADPEGTILAPGGAIMFVVEQDRPVGTCAVIRHDDGTYELAKMAVQRDARGKGYGQWLVSEAIARAKAEGAASLKLLSDEKLTDALRLYERMGFVRKPRPAQTGYARGDVFMVRELTSGS